MDHSGLWSVRGTEFKEGSVLVGDTLDYDGFDVIAAPTRHQVWYRGHRFNSQCKFDVGYGSIELLWTVFLFRLVLTEGTASHKKDQSGSAADWRSPKSGDQEDDGRPG